MADTAALSVGCIGPKPILTLRLSRAEGLHLRARAHTCAPAMRHPTEIRENGTLATIWFHGLTVAMPQLNLLHGELWRRLLGRAVPCSVASTRLIIYLIALSAAWTIQRAAPHAMLAACASMLRRPHANARAVAFSSHLPSLRVLPAHLRTPAILQQQAACSCEERSCMVPAPRPRPWSRGVASWRAWGCLDSLHTRGRG